MSDLVIEVESLHGRFIEDDILELHTPESFTGSFGIDKTKENVDAMRDFVEKHPNVGMMYTMPNKNISFAARRYAMEHTPFGLAMAIITPSAVTKMIANFLLMIKTTPVPTKTFNDREEALAWLREQIDEAKQ